MVRVLAPARKVKSYRVKGDDEETALVGVLLSAFVRRICRIS